MQQPWATEGLLPEKRRMMIDHYETTRGAEHISQLPLALPYRFYTLYSLKLPQLAPGSIIQIHAQFELTSDLGFNAMLAHAMMIHEKETIVANSAAFPSGEFVMPCVPAGENITPNMHHGFRTLAGSRTIDRQGDAWVSVLVYGASTAATQGDALTVERRYGGLSAVVTRLPEPSRPRLIPRFVPWGRGP